MGLDEGGRQQAECLGRCLAAYSFTEVIVSPLRRTVETAEIAGLMGRATLSADLMEWDYGDYEGLTTAQIRAERPGWSIWDDGVPGGETLEQVAERAGRIVARTRMVSGDVLLVAHAHLLRVLAACWLEAKPGFGRHLVLGPASLSVLAWEREEPVISSWNASSGTPG